MHYATVYHSHHKMALLLNCLWLVAIILIDEISAEPARVATVVLPGETVKTCPSQEILNVSKEVLKKDIAHILQPSVVGNCPCGGPGEWTRIAHLNMSDPSQQCPTSWDLITTPIRACGRVSRGCYSAIFPSNGQSYSRVCGRVIAYQKGTPNGFESGSLESAYLEGVSLTHGAAGSRQHIWSFVAAYHEGSNDCPCVDTTRSFTSYIPPFIGNNYFCATAAPAPPSTSDFNPLWDGEGCSPTNACCEFNNPPWFCTTLPQPTTDDLELRNCAHSSSSSEDTLVSLIDIYIM